jgi:hypothetical protein
MATKREQILDQIITLLSGTTNVGSRIYRSRVVPISRGESPALIVEPISDNAEHTASLPKYDWSLQVRVSVICRGDVPDEVADPVVESLYSKLMADRTLNGKAMDIEPIGVNFEMIDADQPAGVISTNWLVRYRTSLASLST